MRLILNATGLEVEVESEETTARLGRAIAEVVKPGVVIGLIGPLGAGKTRLARAIAEALDVDPLAITSPTFVLIHEYDGRLPIYHFDAYRLESPQAFEDLGVADYWAAGGLCLVEWADRVKQLLPADTWLITIEPLGPESRRVRIDLPECAQHVASFIESSISEGRGAAGV
jgi:tRNA threonylcarbamoyladenosine biosynthesis protein TsaE